MRERLQSKLDDEWTLWEEFSLDGRARVRILADPELWRAFQAAYMALGVDFGTAFDGALRAWVEARCAEHPELTEALRRATEPRPGPLAGPGEG